MKTPIQKNLKMNRLIVFFNLCFIVIQAHAQLKGVKQTNRQLKIAEKFSVLKVDPNIKEGPYLKYVSNLTQKNILIAKGQYAEN